MSQIASIIMETVSPESRITNLRKVKTVGGGNDDWYLQFHANFQDFDNLNRNGRIYRAAAMMEAFQAPEIRELVGAGSWCGEAGHPITDHVPRILTIDPKLISHRIVRLDLSDTLASGIDETLCTLEGKNFRNCIAQGMLPAYSLRALAKIDRSTGTQIVERCKAVCFDSVILPSHKIAYADRNKPMMAKDMLDTAGIVTESAIGLDIYSNTNTADDYCTVIESQILDRALAESINVADVFDMYNFSKGSKVKLSNNLQQIIVNESSMDGSRMTVSIDIDEKIKKDIRSAILSI